MRHFSHEISVATSEPIEFVDITGAVGEALERSGVKEGLATVFSRHTTCAIKINERCARLMEDMREHLEAAVPGIGYRHDEGTIDGRRNGRGHLMSMMLGASETIPVAGGRLGLGRWQSVFFIELDGPRSERRITVKIVGE